MLNYDAFTDYWAARKNITAEQCREKFRSTDAKSLIRSPRKFEAAIEPQLRGMMCKIEDERIDWARILPAGFYYDFTSNDQEVKAVGYSYWSYASPPSPIRNHSDFTSSTTNNVCLMEGDTFMLPKFKLKNASQQPGTYDLLSQPLTFTLAVCV